MPSPIAREFLGWDQPLLPSAVRWLAQKYARPDELNFGEVIVVVPGRRAGRRLLELLVLRAEQDRRRLIPPRIVTLGALPEQLYPLQRPLANDLVQQLTWTQVLRESIPARRAWIVPRPPAESDTLAWWTLGTLLWHQHCELAADGRDFADVARLGRELPGFGESDRWDALRELQTEYLRRLDELQLWDVQTARLVAIQQREPQTERDLVLVGTVDMNRATRQILDLVADRVTALVAAPPDRADQFDEHGCLRPTAWQEAVVEIALERIRVCDGPAEQAEQVAAELSSLGGRYRADEVVVGLADDRLGPFVERELTNRGVGTRWIEGTRLGDSGPCRLLLAAAELLERNRFEDAAAFVRHPDVSEALGMQVNLANLDEAFGEHLPLGPDTLLAMLQQQSSSEVAERLLQSVQKLLTPLRGGPRRLAEWAEPLRSWLSVLYENREADESSPGGRVEVVALSKLSDVLGELADLPPSIAPTVTVSEAIRCAVRRIADEFLPPELVANAVEMLGWLELPLDDTPVAMVTSFNEGFVPTSLNSDLFLPNELRRALGLNDNARRYARDAYAVTLLQQTRREVVWLVGRRDVDGDPLVPSRLLFAIPPEELPQRVLNLMESRLPSNPQRERGSDETSDSESGTFDSLADPSSYIDIPAPPQVIASLRMTELQQPARELTLSVTEFKSYLACPYRYFLRHKLKLESLEDSAVEMDALAFGRTLHEVLRRFGDSEARDWVDAERLRERLLEWLDQVAFEQYGSRRRAAVNVQLKQMESRLEAFAGWQANWRRKGWRIEHVEKSIDPDTLPGLPPVFQVEGVSVWLRGRLDRIDCHETSGEWVIFDYKSGDKGLRPDESHRKKRDWIDLQLPLYRHLAKTLALPNETQLGYINLPKDLAGVGEQIADWTADDLADADQKAQEVALAIARREFWPKRELPAGQFAEFNDICQVGVFGS
jgi:hypothetical protein